MNHVKILLELNIPISKIRNELQKIEGCKVPSITTLHRMKNEIIHERNKPQKKGKKATEKRDLSIVEYYTEHPDATLRACESRFGVSRTTITRILKKHGITKVKTRRDPAHLSSSQKDERKMVSREMLRILNEKKRR